MIMGAYHTEIVVREVNVGGVFVLLPYKNRRSIELGDINVYRTFYLHSCRRCHTSNLRVRGTLRAGEHVLISNWNPNATNDIKAAIYAGKGFWMWGMGQEGNALSFAGGVIAQQNILIYWVEADMACDHTVLAELGGRVPNIGISFGIADVEYFTSRRHLPEY
jgi:hypothetical protein